MDGKLHNDPCVLTFKEYPGPLVPKHPKDCSVTTYVGHRVLKTLIRCNFSPPSSTGQQYLYSGSEDGKVHIWNLDGTVARVIDVGAGLTKAYRSRPLLDEGAWRYFGYEGRRRRSEVSAVVRDVSWHPYESVLVLLRNCLTVADFGLGNVIVDVGWGDRGSNNSCLGGRDRMRGVILEIGTTLHRTR